MEPKPDAGPSRTSPSFVASDYMSTTLPTPDAAARHSTARARGDQISCEPRRLISPKPAPQTGRARPPFCLSLSGRDSDTPRLRPHLGVQQRPNPRHCVLNAYCVANSPPFPRYWLDRHSLAMPKARNFLQGRLSCLHKNGALGAD
jgi:hypothetical protein